MRRIEYPTDNISFENDYYHEIDKTNEHQINLFLSGITLTPSPITFKKLVTAKFEELIDLYSLINDYLLIQSEAARILFYSYFDYETNQPSIANFFMNKRNVLELKTCFYCNIDFINSFNDIGEYSNKIHFINKATIDELKIIVGEAKAILIYENLRNRNIINIEELINITGIGEKTIEKIKQKDLHDIKKLKNHFTLDHFIPKKKHAYFSLSLYNLIPSCYSCNSKFKGARVFDNLNNLKYLSPSSSMFTLCNDLEFKIFYNVDGINLTEKIGNVNLLSDIRVDIENIGTNDEFDTYLEMFKLKGRYVFHKNESLKLVKKRKKYSDTEIEEIARITNRSRNDIKKDIFGTSIFSDNEDNEPFSKYKNDIAKQLGLIK